MSTNTTTSKRKRALVAGLAAVIVTAGIAGASVQATGAWFTATKTATGNSVTAGTLALGAIGSGANGVIAAENAFPMSDAQAADSSNTYKAPIAEIKVQNTGTLPLDYTVALSSPAIVPASGVTATLDSSKIKVAYLLPGATTWTTSTLNAFIAAQSSAPLTNLLKPGTDLAAGANVSIPLRVYWDSTVTNDYQGAKITFSATASAQQVNQ